MARVSSIKRLPREVQALIGELRDGGRTIDEILDKLRELSADVSRSALGRHVKNLDQVAERIRRSREVADALVRRLGDDGAENKTLRLNVELLHSAVMDLFSAEDGSAVTLDPESAMFVARALRDASAAIKTDADHTLRLRQSVVKEAADQAATVATEAGLSKSTVDDIRAKILGVAKAAPKAAGK